jgi:hypothetical protein
LAFFPQTQGDALGLRVLPFQGKYSIAQFRKAQAKEMP